MKQKIPKKLLERIQKVTAKRPRTVLKHILAYGHITTEDLKEKYGYNHPPRAARDVREQGISLETFKVASSSGRKIAAYRLNVKAALERGKTGRRQIPKAIKEALVEQNGPRCASCGGPFDPTLLQVDHRVPYEVAGENEVERHDAFMLLCASCNRTKSWTCEHCRNWLELKDARACRVCYWASPESYTHVALTEIRRTDIAWLGQEVRQYEKLRAACKKEGISIQDGIKRAVVHLLK